MDKYVEAYKRITQGLMHPNYKYTTPEEQGAAIKKCTILESTAIEYSNSIVVNSTDN